MNKPWKVIVVLIGIFAAGGVTGGFVMLRVSKNRWVNRPVPEEWAPKTLKRLAERLDLTPDQQEQIRTMVAESLRAVVSQRLVARADGNGRVPVLEILVANKAVGNLIRENKTFQIRSVLQTGASHGMCLFDVSLAELVKSRVITREEALRYAEDPQRFAA